MPGQSREILVYVFSYLLFFFFFSVPPNQPNLRRPSKTDKQNERCWTQKHEKDNKLEYEEEEEENKKESP